MKTLVEVKCPSCGGSLSVEEDREFIFCQFCGTRIIINDENTYTYRHINDADIKRAETERMVQFKEMELEEKKQGNRTALIILWLVVTTLLFIIGIIMVSTGPKDTDDPGYMIMLIGMIIGTWGGIGLFSFSKNQDKRKNHTQNVVKITSAIANFEGKNFEVISSLLRSAGFSNVSCVALKDLNFLSGQKNGRVESLTIDGNENINEGDIFSANALVTITYHSLS